MEIEGRHSEVEENTDRIIEGDHIMSIIIEITLEETILEKHKIIEVKILEVDIEGIMKTTSFGIGRGKSRDWQYLGNFKRNDKSSSSRTSSSSRAIANRDRIRCFNCREYDHFANVCPTLQIEKEPEQIQQMYNLDEEQTALKVLARDTSDNLIRASSNDTIVDHLTL